MLMLIRVAVVFVLCGLITFCIFGFLATYEPPGFPVWRLIYAAAGLMGLTVVGWGLTRRVKAEPNAAADGGDRSGLHTSTLQRPRPLLTDSSAAGVVQ